MVKKSKKKPAIDSKWIWAGIGIAAIVIMVVALTLGQKDTSTEMIAQTIVTDNGDQKINWDKYNTYDMELSDSLTISAAGTYHLTGSLEGGSVTINASNAPVRLILDNVSIKSSDGPAINCMACDDLVIELIGKNVVDDSTNYSSGDTDTGAILSKGDLTFGGDGTLSVKANYADGIVGKDDLKFNGGTYTIESVDDGIRGTDSVYIMDGNFNIVSQADAIKSTNETDTGKGFVLIEAGNFKIDAGAKGIKAINSILLQGGSFAIEAYDDAIHSDNYIGIISGDYAITAGDDAIHANRELIIDGGNIDVVSSYEGLEAQAITINGGDIKILASDDGLNAGGGNDNSSTTNTGRPGGDAFAANTNCILAVNGGSLYVNAAGDGIDSNGYLYFNGGNVIVDGPTNNGNGALDSGAGVVMQGGSVIAVGASGMAVTLGQNSGVANLSIYFNTMQPAGTIVSIKDSTGNTILSHQSAKTFNHMAAGSDKLSLGETYSVYVNDSLLQEFTISSTTTVIGNSNVNQHNMPGRGPRA